MLHAPILPELHMLQENTQVVGVQAKQVALPKSPEHKTQPVPLEPQLLNQITGGVLAKTNGLPHYGW